MWMIIVLVLLHICHGVNIDNAGYIVYCPCMGRFGNQAEQFLGTLDFAHKLNRTLVVPPWIVYDFSSRSTNGNIFVPYEEWFSIEALQNCFPEKIITMRYFMDNIAPNIWRQNQRRIYCPQGAIMRSTDHKTCPAKEGNPFKPFWDNSNIDFNGGSVAFPNHLSYHNPGADWDKEFPSSEHPVLALIGPPASFPIQEKNRELQKCVEWSDSIFKKTNEFKAEKIGGKYIALHLRNGPDWVRACEHLSSSGSYFMASAQCTGYDNPHELTHAMCFPSEEDVITKVQEVSRKHGIKTLFVGTDKSTMSQEFEKIGFKVITYPENSPIMDLALMSFADAFIGNCVSSFTAFAVRQRQISEKPVYFFSFDKPHPVIKVTNNRAHDEF